MKSTDIARRDREIRRTKKKEEYILKHREKKKELSVGDYIKKLFSLFYFDENKIYNTKDSIEILKLFEDMKNDLPEKEWDNVLRKAIRKTQIKNRDKAFNELKLLLND